MRTLPLPILLALASGCVVYDYDGAHGDCGPDGPCGSADLGGSGGSPGDSADTGEPEVEVTLAFRPNQAEQGEIFAGRITLATGALDLTQISSVTLYGDVAVVDLYTRTDEALVIVDVAGDAETGPVDAVVTLADGDVVLLPSAFEVYAAGSGHSANGDCE
jgi:hypothetical protein